jgi:hypothetical protein
MGVETCRDCGGKVSGQAQTCPQCGARGPKAAKDAATARKGCLWLVALFFAVPLVVTLLIGSRPKPLNPHHANICENRPGPMQACLDAQAKAEKAIEDVAFVAVGTPEGERVLRGMRGLCHRNGNFAPDQHLACLQSLGDPASFDRLADHIATLGDDLADLVRSCRTLADRGQQTGCIYLGLNDIVD